MNNSVFEELTPGEVALVNAMREARDGTIYVTVEEGKVKEIIRLPFCVDKEK